jgi:hypothetical protein
VPGASCAYEKVKLMEARERANGKSFIANRETIENLFCINGVMYLFSGK